MFKTTDFQNLISTICALKHTILDSAFNQLAPFDIFDRKSIENHKNLKAKNKHNCFEQIIVNYLINFVRCVKQMIATYTRVLFDLIFAKNFFLAGVSGNIPVGIAVARQRYTQSSSSTEVQRPRESTTTTVSMPEVVHQSPMQTMGKLPCFNVIIRGWASTLKLYIFLLTVFVRLDTYST